MDLRWVTILEWSEKSLRDQIGIVDIRVVYLHFGDIYWLIGTTQHPH